MESSSNRGDKATIRHCLSPNETSNSRNGLHLNKLLNGPFGHLQTQAIAKIIIACSPQTDGKNLPSKTTSIKNKQQQQITELVSSQSSPQPTSVCGTGRHSAHYRTRKVSSNVNTTDPSIYNSALHARYIGRVVAQKWKKLITI